jgi:hypothetical protein
MEVVRVHVHVQRLLLSRLNWSDDQLRLMIFCRFDAWRFPPHATRGPGE